MSTLTIAFLGQCHTVGYAGVPADAAFPEVCRRILQASRPGHLVELHIEPYFHPAQLDKAVRAALSHCPRVVVIEAVGWLAITGSTGVDLSRLPRRIRSAYERAQLLRRASRAIAEKTKHSGLLHVVRSNALAAASSLLQPLLPRLPRATVAEYEAFVSDALARIASVPGATPVVQGPGAGNFAVSSKSLPADAIERYRSVNEMARRVAAAHGALYIDRWDTVAGGFFIPGTTRPTLQGHSVWGHLLAHQLLRAGLV